MWEIDVTKLIASDRITTGSRISALCTCADIITFETHSIGQTLSSLERFVVFLTIEKHLEIIIQLSVDHVIVELCK